MSYGFLTKHVGKIPSEVVDTAHLLFECRGCGKCPPHGSVLCETGFEVSERFKLTNNASGCSSMQRSQIHVFDVLCYEILHQIPSLRVNQSV